MAIAPMVVAGCLSLAPYFLEFDLERYVELVECYRQGEFLESARDLSERPPERIREFASEFRASERSDWDLQAAALLHVDAIRWFGTDEPIHKEMAQLHIASMADDAQREAFDKKFRLALGYFYFFRLRFEDAETLFRVNAVPPARDWDFGYALGTLNEAMVLTAVEQGSLEAAELEYRWMLEERPVEAALHIRLGHVLWRLGRIEEALGEMEAHLPRLSDEETSARLAAHLVIGAIRRSRGETARSLAHFRSAYALDPACQAASSALALALATAGESSEAIVVTEAYLQSGGHASFTDDPWWQYILGRAVDNRQLFSALQREVRR